MVCKQNTAGQRTLAHTMYLAQVDHSMSLNIGRHHSFELTSQSFVTSSMVSASSFFSLPFSASSVRNGAASDGSMLPYFDLYL